MPSFVFEENTDPGSDGVERRINRKPGGAAVGLSWLNAQLYMGVDMRVVLYADDMEPITVIDLSVLVVAMDVAIGVANVLFSGLIGWLAAAVALLPGYALVKAA